MKPFTTREFFYQTGHHASFGSTRCIHSLRRVTAFSSRRRARLLNFATAGGLASSLALGDELLDFSGLPGLFKGRHHAILQYGEQNAVVGKAS